MFVHSEKAMEILNGLHRERLDYSSKYVPLADAVQALKAYEDTGLAPEEIEAIICASRGDTTVPNAVSVFGVPLERVRELVEADREGRCVVLPCKVGDTVYFVKSAFSWANTPLEAKVINIHGVDRDGKVLYSAVTVHGNVGRWFGSDRIGKTVFLTLEEAEAAIGGTDHA